MLIYWCYSAGQLCVAKGELQMASDSFKIVLDEDGNKLWHHFSYAKMIWK